jgi:hypothetical protein
MSNNNKDFKTAIEFLRAKHFWGISWSKEEVFVAIEDSILFLSKENTVTQLVSDVEFRDIHQILFVDGFLYVTNTKNNTINRIDLFDEKIKKIDWICDNVKIGEKIGNHVNSIYCHDNHFYVCFHNWGLRPAEIRKYDKNFDLCEIYKGIGFQNHNIHIENNTLYSLNSQGKNLIKLDLKTKRVKFKKIDTCLYGIPESCSYGRGLARTENNFFIGLSKEAVRDKRNDLAWIIALDNNLNYVDKLCLPEECQLKDIRVISEPDYAHNGIPFPIKGILF